MSTHLPRREFLTQFGGAAALLGVACPLLAQNQPAPAPAENLEVARLRQQLEWQRYSSLSLLTTVYQKHGAPILETVSEVTSGNAQRQYGRMKVEGERNLQALKKALWEPLPPAFKWELLEESPEKMQFKVHECPMVAEMKKFGVPPELGFALNCASDPGIAAGINPEIKFTRTKTLMQGHCCCDHCYELKQRSAS